MRPLSDSGSREEINPLIHKEPSCSLSFCPYFLLILISFSSLTSSYALSLFHPSLCSNHYICPLLPPTLKSDPMLPHLLQGGAVIGFAMVQDQSDLSVSKCVGLRQLQRMKIICFLYCFVFVATLIKILYFLPFFKFAAG